MTTGTQTERTRAIVEQLYVAYLNGDTERMLALMAPDVAVTFNYAGTFHGMNEARSFMLWNGGQLRELVFDIQHTIVDGAYAAVTWSETGKTIRDDDWAATGVDVYRIDGDRIVEMTCYSDTDKVARLLDPYPGNLQTS